MEAFTMRGGRMALAALPVLLMSPTSGGTEDPGVDFSATGRNGVCMVEFGGIETRPDLGSATLQLSYRVRDGNFGAAMFFGGVAPSGKEAAGSVPRPMTLIFDGGRSTRSRSGGYSTVGRAGLWGGWGPGRGSEAAIALLAEARSVRAISGDRDLGRVDFHGKGAAGRALSLCANRIGSA